MLPLKTLRGQAPHRLSPQGTEPGHVGEARGPGSDAHTAEAALRPDRRLIAAAIRERLPAGLTLVDDEFSIEVREDEFTDDLHVVAALTLRPSRPRD